MERIRRTCTLLIPSDGKRLLLGLKKRGFGAGKWNGFGGKVEIDETYEGAARRELLEEAHVRAGHIDKRGLLLFTFDNEPGLHLEVHVYATEKVSGTPVESEEMAPRWFGVDEIPYDSMWKDDEHWLPLFLAKRRFVGRFHFHDHGKIAEYSLKEVDKTHSLLPDPKWN